MKFGKRRDPVRASGEEPPVAASQSNAEAITGGWPAPAAHAASELGATSAPPPVGPGETAPVQADTELAAEPYVEGEAVELPGEPRADIGGEPPDVAIPVASHVYEPLMRSPPAYEPPVHEAPDHAAVPGVGASYADAAQRLRSELPADLAERPEIVVGAALGGGFLLALILRRLGH